MKPIAEKGKKIRDLTGSDMLEGIPHVNQKAKISRGKDAVLIEIPTRRPGYLVPPISWIIKFHGTRSVSLDQIGVDLLDLCDGKRTVENIIEEFAIENKLSFREAQLPVTQFLTSLTEHGILAVAFLK